jgi:hypothetical protein
LSIGQINEYTKGWSGGIESGSGYATGTDGKIKEIDADFFNLVSDVKRIPKTKPN